MKQLRHLVPSLGFLALLTLFLMLPESPSVGCKTCSSSNPYIPLIGAGYFSTLIALSLLFPTFPGPFIARGGLTWSVLLALVFTTLNFPNWCILCLIGHGCHIAIWTIWVMVPAVKNNVQLSNRKERLCLLVFAPFSVVALFSCLNLTFMAYGFKIDREILSAGLKLGDTMPIFNMKTIEGHSISNIDAASSGGIVMNFISPNCPYCEEQLQILSTVVDQLASKSYRCINISSALLPELIQRSPATEWVEDKEGNLRKLFKVSGYPTMFVIDAEGKIAQVIPGVSNQLKSYLTSLFKPKNS